MVRFNVAISSILGSAYYRYEIDASDYNPNIDDTITVTCTVKTVMGNTVGGKSVTLYNNGSVESTQTTNSNGVATWSVSCNDWGEMNFKVENKTIQVYVDGWKKLYENGGATIQLFRNKLFAKLLFNGHSFSLTKNTWSNLGPALATPTSNVAPRRIIVHYGNDINLFFRVENDGTVSASTSGTTGTRLLIGQIEWSIRDDKL